MTSLDEIKALLTTAFTPSHLDIEDDSHHHSGHYQHRSTDPSHITVHIKATSLTGISRVKQHQAIHKVLAPALADGLHAIQIKVVQ